MPAAEMIASGAIEDYAAAFRHCRDIQRSRQSCADYARRRIERNYPTESARSIDAFERYARAAVDRGTNYMRGAAGYSPGNFANPDPVELLRQRYGAQPIVYRYRVAVITTYGAGTSGQTSRIDNQIIDSRSELTRAEIENLAAAQHIAAPNFLDTLQGGRGQDALQEEIAIQIQSATRTRLI